ITILLFYVNIKLPHTYILHYTVLCKQIKEIQQIKIYKVNRRATNIKNKKLKQII
uniref:Uncharacterized protein n=1 Tax=Ciona intestinalis TaxID=7719 RepID=H2XSC6_CIOIN